MNIPLVDLKAQYESIKKEIDRTITEVISSTQFIMGPYVEDFEKKLAKHCGCKHAIGVSSGSSALFLALKAYGLKEDDEVITVPNTFIATAEAIVQCGAKPIFVDVEEKTMLMDPKKIENAITKKTRGIIPVHLYGQICDMDPIITIAKKHGLFILEDAAQAINAEYKGKKLPVYETAILSFFPSKNLGCYGDGGAVITNDDGIARQVSKLRDHGRTSKYESDIIGYGERLDGIQAAVLTTKLKHIDRWTDMRISNAKLYDEMLDKAKSITLPYKEKHSKHVYYLYVIRVKERQKLIDFLKDKEVSTGIHYPVPLHLQKAFEYLGYKKGSFPICEKTSNEILSLPMYPELDEEKIKYITKMIVGFENAI